ncbi:acylneuraminate cytidylyltransferase family protein [Brachybacterium sp. Marseille-Q2903]|uniref:Acylneuraminate cytidylyltransferase family protein n=1 Tax=Brachybacterium epidermidis TaxID=2781983 RepID=A0ABR9VYY1_9MICO|nr:acylneuraminate cytidylyltransferase family protein [Brachybacterium epidermidis]
MSVLCVIPARGGSKGIPRKNLLPVGGKPLIAWTIAQALATTEESDLIVAVSTEDEKIARVAREHGARVIERPVELAQDTTATEPVLLHAMDVAEAQGIDLEAVMLLQATSPVRLPGTLDRAVAQFRDSGCDSLIGVLPQSPFFWHLPEADGEQPRADYDWTARPRRQDLTAGQHHYFENGSLYVTAPHVYRETRNRIGGRISLFVLDELEGVDIDTEADVAAAERMLARTGWSTTA